MAFNALQGMKASLVELEEISDTFCSIPADRTSQSIRNLWCHGLSTSALGHFLRSIRSTGLRVFFVQEFINFYLYPTRNENEGKAPFSLVNQAFAVSIRKLLEGYLCALNTLSASVELRRSSNQNCYSDITLLEVYLHTEESRRFVESIGNICFPKHLGLDLARDDLNTETVIEFHKFFRGAELLSYLYVQLQVSYLLHNV
jgi:gamma-tubulin complex component 6